MGRSRKRLFGENKVELDFCYDRLIAQKLSIAYETILSSEPLIKEQKEQDHEKLIDKENSSYLCARFIGQAKGR